MSQSAICFRGKSTGKSLLSMAIVLGVVAATPATTSKKKTGHSIQDELELVSEVESAEPVASGATETDLVAQTAPPSSTSSESGWTW